MSSDSALVAGAVATASRKLVLKRGQNFARNDLSVILKHLLVAKFEETLGPIDDLRRGYRLNPQETGAKLAAIAAGTFRFPDELANRIVESAGPIALVPSDVASLLAGRDYTNRVIQLALEEVSSERLSPELKVSPTASRYDALTAVDRYNYAVVFEQVTNFTNEFYPLVIDAYVHDLGVQGKPVLNVIGVHTTWLTECGRARRAILYDHDSGELIETGLEHEVPVHFVHVLCAGQEAHAIVSETCTRNSIPEANPYDAASLADDKMRSYELWKERGVPTPESVLVSKGSRADKVLAGVDELLRKIEARSSNVGVIVQPNQGTEGIGVRAFDLPRGRPPGADDGLVTYATDLAAESDVLVRQCIDGIRYAPDAKTDGFACDLRVNVAYDGSACRAESGFLQVAATRDDTIASTGAGGRIVHFSRGALDNLAVVTAEGALERVRLGREEMELISNVACAAASVFGKVLLVGIDVRLTLNEQVGGRPTVVPVVLDANPRPAGLSHSEKLTLETGPEPSATYAMWTAVELRVPGG